MNDVRKRTLSHGSEYGIHLLTSVGRTPLAPCLSPLGHRPLTTKSRRVSSQQPAFILIILVLQSLVQCFQVLSPQLLPSLTSSHKVVFARTGHRNPPSCLWLLSSPKGLSLFDSHSAFCRLAHFSVVKVQVFQFIPFNLCRLLGRGRASPHRPAAVPTSQIQCAQCG